MSYHSERYKREVYEKWKKNGQLWFSKDPSKDPTAEERKIILEMKKRENDKVKRDIQLERSAKDIKERYEKKGVISDKIFHLDKY